jgi:hypothetical protein
MRGTGGTQLIGRAFDSLFPIPYSLFFNHEVNNFSLADVETGLGLKHFPHLDAVELLVALGAGAPDGRAARSIQEAELDADGIGNLAHDAAERIDLAHQVALGHAANRWIAAHLGDEIHVHGDERGFQAHTRRSHGRFAAGVPGAHHDDIVLFGERHPILFYGLAGIAIGESNNDQQSSQSPKQSSSSL